jgi:hypothetical protein
MAIIKSQIAGPVVGMPPAAIPATSMEQRLAALESRLAVLEKVLNVQSDGSLAMKAVNLVVNAQNIAFKTAQGISLQSGGGTDIKSSAGVMVMAASTATLQAYGATTVKGATLTFNGTLYK